MTTNRSIAVAAFATLLLAVPARAAPPAGGNLGWRAAWRKARQEMQVYRGDRLERWSNRLAVGRSDFSAKLSVKANLEKLAKDRRLPHYYADVGGRQVLHVVVDLAKGKQTKQALRSVMRRVGKQTIELNYKQASPKNRYGHVAVRVGDNALYDLIGTHSGARLPWLLEKAVKLLRGHGNLSFARKRNLRRFMESRKGDSSSIYFGMLFSASPAELKQTRKLYNKRLKQVKEFSINGGDASKGVFSCAQFLTEGLPFLNDRGVASNIGAKGVAKDARDSSQLEAVVVYRMPGASGPQLTQFP